MALRISRVLLAEIVSHARAAAPQECCGLLLGRQDHRAALVQQVRPSPNVAEDPLRQFEVDPALLIAAHREARGGGPAVIGHYHSHPRAAPIPSGRDAALAHERGMIWLIVGADGTASAWRARGTAGPLAGFEPVQLACTGDDEGPSGLASGGRISA